MDARAWSASRCYCMYSDCPHWHGAVEMLTLWQARSIWQTLTATAITLCTLQGDIPGTFGFYVIVVVVLLAGSHFLWSWLQKSKEESWGKKCHLWILKIMLWLAKARTASTARAMAVQQEGFSEENVHNKVMGCLWHFCRTRRNPSRPNLWWGQQLPDDDGAE